MTAETRARCGDCGKTRPVSDTARCPGHSKGNWRMAGRPITRRVCRECVQARVDYARAHDSHVNTSHFAYTYAADALGIDWSDVRRDAFTKRSG